MKVAKELYMYVLGAVIVLAIILVTGLLIIYPIPTQNHDIVLTVIGALVTAAITVITFFFGSSKGSADKTELLSKKNEEEL